MADLFDGLGISIRIRGEIFDRDVTTAVCSIAIYGTKGEVYVCGVGNFALGDDATTVTVNRLIARDGAVDQRERAVGISDAVALLPETVLLISVSAPL